MSEDLVMDAMRIGVVFGIGVGIVLSLVGAEVRGAYREWKQRNDHQRQVRCLRDWK